MPSALDGLLIADFGRVLAGPYATMLLGDLGADVVKIEPPGVGDAIRGWGAQKDGVGLMWKSIGRNKRSVTVDLRTPDDLAGLELDLRLGVPATGLRLADAEVDLGDGSAVPYDGLIIATGVRG